jgi:hypothetical protein
VRIDQRCSGQGCKDSHSFPASQTAGVDVNRTLRIATLDASIGRNADLLPGPDEWQVAAHKRCSGKAADPPMRRC